MVTEGKRFKFYRRTSFGISVWETWYLGNIIYYSHAVSEHGIATVNTEDVQTNQSGRPLVAQIELQMRSRLSKMLDKGYKPSREEAMLGSTNQLGLYNPMLALPINQARVGSFDQAHVQIKYDGHRCLITRHEGKLIAYTRKGKLIHTIPHILKPLEGVVQEGMTLDGELYVHGRSLQSISSLIKREQEDSRELCYHAYDMIEDMSFSDRLIALQNLLQKVENEQLFCAPTTRITDLSQAYRLFRDFRVLGHEGAMLRLDLRGYEDSKRSDQLLKIKERHDEDFTVVDIKPGKHDIGILILKLNDRPGTFDCTAPGSVPTKQSILANKPAYIGRKVMVLFANKTADGIPFHGVADRFLEEV